MKRMMQCILFLLYSTISLSQYKSTLPANEWVDSVFNSLNKKKRIAQLFIIRAHSNKGPEYADSVGKLIKKYDVGGLCFFQGGPVRQATLTNYYQSIAQTPLLITMDAEWGVGMRLDSVPNYPRQMFVGATPDATVAYSMGKAIGEQCKRLGVQMNFAPVLDVNNNPANPVINDRSFGEDKYKVALYGVQYMKGMQDAGVLACAKHFPGHGDVTADSHFELPVVTKSRSQLDSLELYPFRAMIKEGVASLMNAHLFVPAIDTTSNQPSSLSYNSVTGLLKNELGYKGLVITDGLEMQAVTKYYPSGEASAQALIAGNDLLLLPEDIKGSIRKIKRAMRKHKVTKDEVYSRVKKVLLEKYNAGLNEAHAIDTTNLVNDLNSHTESIRKSVAENGITLLRKDERVSLPLNKNMRIAYAGIGTDTLNAFAKRLQQEYHAQTYTFGYKADSGTADNIASALKANADVVVIGVHNYSRRPANRFGISNAAYYLINKLQSQMPAVTFVFGNPYAIKYMDAASERSAGYLFACYENDSITQEVAADMLQGKLLAKGKLPVTINLQFPAGAGITESGILPFGTPESVGMHSEVLDQIDSIANDAIAQHATPGCVVLVAKDGKVVFDKAYGYTFMDKAPFEGMKLPFDSFRVQTLQVTPDMIYDLASVTKISATTIALMKLWEQGRLDIDKPLGYYLPWVKGSNKENLLLKDMLMHQAGLEAWIPFYKATIDKEGHPLPTIYRTQRDDTFSIRVAENLYMRNDYVDSMYQRILRSGVGPRKYEYSDNDFIFLGKVVEAIAGKPLDVYMKETFYQPLQMTTTSFKPREHFPLQQIAPTQPEDFFREQTIWGDVHDPAAAMFGGVAGHAGLFSNAYDLAKLFQMLLNGGELNGIRFLEKTTIDKFTAYNSSISRRGLGFDKPEKDNATRSNPYPARYVSPLTYGHTGFTGTCVWVDPAYNLIYIFLSNRVAYDKGDNNKLHRMKVRASIQDVIYTAMKAPN